MASKSARAGSQLSKFALMTRRSASSPASAARRGELLAELDAGDRIAGHGKWQRRLTSPASDLCETCLRRKLCEGNQVVEDLPRIVGTGAVVSSGACSRVVLRRSCGAFEHGSMMPERRLATTSLLAYALGRGRSETERLPFTVKAA